MILLSGPPGFGKSTLITAIAREMCLNMYVVSITALQDKTLPFIFDGVKKNHCLVLEDVDSVDASRDETDVKGNSHASRDKPVSLSSFLNLLDGAYSVEGSVIIMTTNCPEKLDPAVIRPERIHLHLKFGPEVGVYERWTRRFYPDAPSAIVEEIAATSLKRSLSTAALQSVFRRCETIDRVMGLIC